MKKLNSLRTLLALALITLLLCSFSYKNEKKSTHSTGLLSDTIHVANYAIHLNVLNLSGKTIGGYTQLTITPRVNNVNAIELYLLKLTVDSIFANDTLIPSYSYNDTLLRMPLHRTININDTISLKIYYHGQPQMDISGFGGFYFTDTSYAYNLGVGLLAVPPCYGRVWFPCVDDFVDRSTYDCYIRVKNSMNAVCGGTLMNVTNNGDGTSTYYWKLHSTIPTYLASVAVADYVSVNSTFNGINGSIPIKIFVPAADTTSAKASFINLQNILHWYESSFGPYMWERVGYVGVTFNGGSMEHATNIAYPLACINGNLAYEDLYAHELSHHWFGDLVTCATAKDMWLNEGWATYCESFYREGIYGYSSYASGCIANHYSALSTCNVKDNGYYAICGIPANLTYGTTVYTKGADVVYTLRNYLGDSLFFSMLKLYMANSKFNHVSTLQFRDSITKYTGVNMNDFFEGWVLTPGFPQYSIDSMVYAGTGYDYIVYAKQRLRHKANFINSNKIEITFMSSTWQQYTQTIQFSGQTGSQLFHLPFTPVAAMLDLNSKVSDARTSYYSVIKTTGTTDFTNSFFMLNVQNVTDSAFFRIEYNWVPPDPLKSPSTSIFRLSPNRYWKVDGIFPTGFKAQGEFSYDRSSSGFEDTLLITPLSTDSLVLLYRADAAADWHVVSFVRTGGLGGGLITAQNLQRGEYTLGIGLPNQLGINEIDAPEKPYLKVYPNPSNDTFNIWFSASKNSEIRIYDASNKLVYSKKVSSKLQKLTWKPLQSVKGTYFIYLYENGKPVATDKAVFVQ